MTAFWIAAAVVAALSAAWLARPFLFGSRVESNESEASVSIFQDQADELRRDRDAGLISEGEFDAAHEEIEARALRAARGMGQGLSISRRSPLLAAGIGGLAVAGTLGIYLSLGTPNAVDQPLEARRTAALMERAAAGDPTSRLQLLIDKTKEEPDSFETWWALAHSYTAAGDHASAADAYRRAAELSGDRPSVLSAYAESLTLANGNKVPTAARLVFEQILQSTPDPRARYYVALSKAQAQDFEAALSDWSRLAADSVPDAPWMPLVRRDIVNMARFLKKDVTYYLPDATPQEVARATGAPVDAAPSSGQVAALQADLDADPMDHKKWIELARLQVASGDDAQAAAAIAEAKRHFAAAPFVLARIDAAAREFGLDVLEPSTEARVSGPGAEDVAAASAMSESERADMIKGMVAGLAAKLEENPDNPDGWIMLIRSYSVLEMPDKAQAAYADAVAHFEGDDAVLVRLQAQAAEMLSGG